MDVNNKYVIVVLKTDSLLILDQIVIPTKFEIYFQNLWKGFEIRKLDYHKRVNIIGSDITLRPLLSHFNFAKSLGAAYQGLKSNSHENMMKLKPTEYHESVTKENIEKAESKKNDRLKTEYDDRILAYNLSALYTRLDSTESILTYSHRKVGWSNPLRRVDENFTFQAKTNFGYGSPSYFFTVMTYKGINVVPFCEVILYRRAKVAEILCYSSKHKLNNDSWNDALDYLCNASNTYLKDEVVFVQKYIVDEIERFVTTLSDILYDKISGLEVINNEYKYLNREKEYIDLKKYSHDTIEYKGDRISESLQFIPILTKMSSYHDFSNEIESIQNLNKEVLFRMEKRLPEIDNHLSSLRRKAALSKINYDSAKIEKDKFTPLVQKRFIEFRKTDTNNTAYLSYERMFAKSDENFRLAYNRLVTTTSIYNEHTLEFRRFQIIKDNIEKYISIIKAYFKSK